MAADGPAIAAESVAMAMILILEDDPFILQLAELLLADQGHETLSASDRAEALTHLKSGLHIDLLFSDVRLNNSILGGLELARTAVELRPGLRVLYASGAPMTDETTAMLVEGGQFLRKPYGDNDLQNAVNALLH